MTVSVVMARDKAKQKARNKRYYDAHREKCQALSRAYQQKHASHLKARRKLYKQLYKETHIYKIPVGTIEKLKQLQQNRCALCGMVSVRLRVDHCHNSGLVRALLCHNCNVGLGHFHDRTDLLQAAIYYLDDWKEVLHAG